jgi:tetratricopeptide (TPR) repeat protein
LLERNEMSERMQKLMGMLEKSPADAFVLYGVGLEYKKAGEFGKAIEFLDRAIGVDPGYCYAYYQKGQVYEEMGKAEEAKGVYREGIVAAGKKGDAHAKGELESALMMIE